MLLGAGRDSRIHPHLRETFMRTIKRTGRILLSDWVGVSIGATWLLAQYLR